MKLMNESIIRQWPVWHRSSMLASHPSALGLIFGIPKNFSLDAAEIYCNGLRLDNVN